MAEKIRNFIVKLQSLPENAKKIILFLIVGICALIMGFFWIKSTAYNFSKIGESLQSISLPKLEIPQDERLKEVQNIINNPDKNTSDILQGILGKEINPQNSQTSDWQTYKSDQYGFEVKYPQNFFSLEKKSANKEVVLWDSFADNQLKDAKYIYSTLDIQVVKTDLLPVEWIKDNFKEGIFNVNPQDIKEINLNGKQAFQFTVAGKNVEYYYTILNVTRENLAVLAYHKVQNEDKAAYQDNIYQNFLSTYSDSDNLNKTTN